MSTFYVPSSESTTLSAIAPSVSRDSANSAPTMHWDLAHFLTTPPMSAPASFCSFPQHDLQIRPSTDAGLVDSQPFDFSHLAQASPHNSSALPSTSHLPSPASLPPPSPLSRSLSSQSATPATLSELAAILKAPRPKSPRKPTIKKEKRAFKARAITTKHPPLRNEMPSVLVPMDVKPTSVLEVPKLEVVVPEPLFRSASPEAVEMPHTPPSSATSPIASTLVASPVSASFAPLGDWTTFSLPPTPTVEAGLPLNVALMTADEEERKPKRPKKMPEGYIKRPSNAWMIYRSARVKEFAERQKNGGSVVPPQSDLSKVIAELWRSETLDVREAYARLALAEAEEHPKRYPEYTFKPAKVARKVAPKRVVDESAASAPSTSSSSTAPSKRVRRPALKKSHTVSGGESYQELLPAFELPTPLSHYYPSSSYTSASDSNSYTDPSAFVDITLGLGSLLTPPTPAVTEAWSSFAASTAPTPSSSSSSWFDVLSGISSSLQLDISSSCFPIPASAPANLTSFDFTFDLPSPPLAGVAAVVALPSPPVDESMQPSGSVYDEIVAMLARAPEPSTAPLPSPAGLVFVPPPSANTSIHSSRSRIDLDTFLREIGSATSSSS